MSERIIETTAKATTASEALMRKRLKSGKFRLNEDEQLEKYCARCHEYWPADTEFYFSNSGTNDGLSTWCKACYLENRYPNGRSAQEQKNAA
ncbi:hypothetical protein GALL_71720 [mine drainage metagenome]|uniref:Uncharacterized protein n=1 Tax=mine drainage metagenome TaxID=410659 RepID=A0A1J5SR72_9ZZZZ